MWNKPVKKHVILANQQRDYWMDTVFIIIYQEQILSRLNLVVILSVLVAEGSEDMMYTHIDLVRSITINSVSVSLF